LIAAVSDALDRGGLVIFPTETVYGIGGRWDLATTASRLREAKGRDEGKPFQVLVEGAAEIERMISEMPLIGRAFARAFWPGPLTLVTPTRSGVWLGLRHPNHDAARAVVRCAGGSLLATSANRSGDPPALRLADAVAAVGQAAELAVENGRGCLGLASTVVRVRETGWDLLRDGAIDRAALIEVAGRPPQGERP
jgi:L-threonylcarbamoyladenylate synthase